MRHDVVFVAVLFMVPYFVLCVKIILRVCARLVAQHSSVLAINQALPSRRVSRENEMYSCSSRLTLFTAI